MDVYEVLRLLQLQKSDRAIAGALGINRKTVGKYRAWAAGQGLLAQRELPSREELHRRLAETWPGALPPQNVSSVAPFRDVITELREQGVEVAAIFQRLQDEHGYAGSYSSVWRFVSSPGAPAAGRGRAHRSQGRRRGPGRLRLRRPDARPADRQAAPRPGPSS